MDWIKLQFRVSSEIVEPLSNVLEAFLAQAVTTENAGDDAFYEAAFPKSPDWEIVNISALFDEKVDVAPIIDFVQQHLARGKEIPTSIEKLEDQDWQRVWLKSFKPIQVGKKLWVCPSWCEPEQPNERNILLDPGLAFGTGTHPTTHLCLQWLSEQTLNEQSVLDYGAGSGILAIAALLCGADHATATDIDPMAITACKDNAKQNRVDQRLTTLLPDELPAKQFDIVIANILADVIIELRQTLLSHLHESSVLLLTGILQSQADRVKQAFADDIEFSMVTKEDWCMLIGKETNSQSAMRL